MHRLRFAGFAAVVGLMLIAGQPQALAAAGKQAPPPTPKAYVLVDADTGAVIAQQDAHTNYKPASTIKLLTALAASQRVAPNDPIPISPVAEGMPARKINVKA